MSKVLYWVPQISRAAPLSVFDSFVTLMASQDPDLAHLLSVRIMLVVM
jgi:hypothetical protein